jgi:hypothetical protein
MSVGTIDPKSQGSPPAPVSRPRFVPRSNHHVSYKLTKPKHSKAKQLSREELTGIGLSILLSFAIAIALVCIGIYIVPVILRVTAEVIQEFVDSTRSPVAAGKSDLVSVYSRFLTIRSDLSCSTFSADFENKEPVLFQTETIRNIPIEWVSVRDIVRPQTVTLRPLGAPVEASKDGGTDITMTIDELMRGEFSLSRDAECSNYWVSDENLLRLPSVATALQHLLVPQSTRSNETCTMRSPPLADFVPEVLTVARSTPQLSGGAFHMHKRSVSVLLEGRKRWILFPPNQVHDTPSVALLLGVFSVIPPVARKSVCGSDDNRFQLSVLL